MRPKLTYRSVSYQAQGQIMIMRLPKQKLLASCLLAVIALSQPLSLDGKTQRAKSKAKDECAKCPSANQGGEPCPDCPIPENIDPHSDKPIPMGLSECGQSRHHHPLSESATRTVEPKYPEEAKKKGIKGSVVVEVTTDEEGKVSKARALTGHKLLRKAAIEAAKDWRFTPTQLNGKPVKIVGTITFIFKNEKGTWKTS
jgi:TonB family protein